VKKERIEPENMSGPVCAASISGRHSGIGFRKANYGAGINFATYQECYPVMDILTGKATNLPEMMRTGWVRPVNPLWEVTSKPAINPFRRGYAGIHSLYGTDPGEHGMNMVRRFMKPRLFDRLFLFMCSLLCSSTVLAYPAIRVVPDNPLPEKGQKVTADIMVDLTGSSHTLGAYSLVITWNPRVLSYAMVAGGTSRGYGSVNLNASQAAYGRLTINQFYAPPPGEQPVSRLFTVARVAFSVVGGEGDSTSVMVSVSSLAAARTFTNLKPGLTVQPGMVTVRNNPPIISAAMAQIKDLAVEKASERWIILSWTAPSMADTPQPAASYVVEISTRKPVNNTIQGTVFDPRVTPGTPGKKETVTIPNLKPGSPYYIAVRSVDRSGRVSNNSAILATGTMVAFTDEDLDPDDPFLPRDQDSLFVADNDMFLRFDWSPAEDPAGTLYRIRVFSEGDKTIIGTKVVTATYYVVEAPEEGFYSIDVTPLLTSGETLPPLKSRVIGCSPQGVEPPGRPVLITNGGQ
jgi:hypothetical protein